MLLALGGCGVDQRPECATSSLTYETFGEPFVVSWCRGCHSRDVAPAMRKDAPLDVNFDTHAEIRAHRSEIMIRTLRDQMPPVGGPSDEERELALLWLGCGAP